jgi:uncharacterized protein (DUF1330 family)
MPAYLFVDEVITDAEAFEEYRRQVMPSLMRFGGRFLFRGGPYELLEEQRPWQPGRLVLIEFPDMASLRGWYGSPEYEPVRAIRHGAARSTMVAMDAG